MPEFTWNGLSDGNFEVTPVRGTPLEAHLWTATNPEARDFRETADVEWTSTPIDPDSDGSYRGTVSLPPDGGYTAFYIALTYQDNKISPPYCLATPMTVLGD